jgi:hypothetical protein
VVESIFAITAALQLRQTLPSNISPEALSQSVEPDALLLQGFHQIRRSDTSSRAHVGEGFVDKIVR